MPGNSSKCTLCNEINVAMKNIGPNEQFSNRELTFITSSNNYTDKISLSQSELAEPKTFSLVLCEGNDYLTSRSLTPLI